MLGSIVERGAGRADGLVPLIGLRDRRVGPRLHAVVPPQGARRNLGMPIYKISRRSQEEDRARAVYRRTRLAALLISRLLFAGTFLLLLFGPQR